MTDAAARSPLASALARALAPVVGDAAQGWIDALAAQVGSPDDPEASVRVDRGAVRGGRMMLERAPRAAVHAIAAGLGLGMPPVVGALLDAAAVHRLPIITGWDVSADEPLYKVYANAADAAEGARRAIGDVVGLAAGACADIVGLNVRRRGGPEAKAYFQRATPSGLRDLFDALGAPGGRAVLEGVPPAFWAYARAPAWVLSCDVAAAGSPTPRAVFVAASARDEGGAAALVESLTGVAWTRLRDAFPFEPGPIRQVGVDLRGGSAEAPRPPVTVYAKPAGTTAPLHALAPLAVFAAAGAEVGAYVTPSDATPRAYARTAAHALSFRTRAGAPDRAALAALAAWLVAELRQAERRGAPPEALPLDRPPAQWRRVDG